MDTSQIKEHMEVLGSDGQHVGTVDHMEGGEKIKLTKSDSDSHGHHHLIPVAWVAKVDSRVHLSKSSREVMDAWEHVA